jgi:hypothetical protein
VGRQYAVYSTVVDKTHANAHTAWVEMGKPRPPGLKQRKALERASRLGAEKLDVVRADEGGVEFAVSLCAHSVCLLELVPV